MATDEYVWMNNTGTGPVAVPDREVEGKLRRGWTMIQEPRTVPAKSAAKPKAKPKE